MKRNVVCIDERKGHKAAVTDFERKIVSSAEENLEDIFKMGIYSLLASGAVVSTYLKSAHNKDDFEIAKQYSIAAMRDQIKKIQKIDFVKKDSEVS